MNKQELEQFKDKSKDLLYWIKEYLASKVYRLKINKGIENFNRESNYDLILSSSDINELKNNTNVVTQKMSGLSTYSSPLINFYNFVISKKGKIVSLTEIDTNYINSYTKREKLSIEYFKQIRSFFKFVDKYNTTHEFNIGFLKDGTKAKLPMKMKRDKTFNFLEPDVFAEFIGNIKNYNSNHPNPFVVKLMLKFFCFGGLRADEVQHLKEKDLSFKEIEDKKYMQLYVLGKGSKERFIYILYDLIKDDYEKYLNIKKENNHNTEYLFYSRTIKMFSDKRIYDIIKHFNDNTLEVPNLSPHVLRRSFSVFLHYSGVSLETISKILGHNQEETIEFYVFATKEKSKEVPNLFKFI
ncbi:MAG: site-specific integrase [Arcobacteraceae bacterium]|jgi:site-specific recombinase XerD|nr:site-specific integrase [Arcobacteraceae bacterium]